MCLRRVSSNRRRLGQHRKNVAPTSRMLAQLWKLNAFASFAVLRKWHRGWGRLWLAWLYQISVPQRSPTIRTAPHLSCQTPEIDLMLVWCWANVTNGGPTLNQHTVDVSCLLGSCQTNRDLVHLLGKLGIKYSSGPLQLCIGSGNTVDNLTV